MCQGILLSDGSQQSSDSARAPFFEAFPEASADYILKSHLSTKTCLSRRVQRERGFPGTVRAAWVTTTVKPKLASLLRARRPVSQ